MKKCEQIKDLILTDYIDGRLNPGQAGLLEQHLLDCPSCRVFFQEAKASSVPFKCLGAQEPPPEIWRAIQQRIEEKSAASPLRKFVEKIEGLMAFPRLLTLLASATAMLVVGTVSFNIIHTRETQTIEQGEYLASLLSNSGAPENNDAGTSIERYFL